MGWTFVWLMVGLKIPIVALFLIVRWAVKQTGDGVGGEPISDDDGGIRPHGPPRVDGPRTRGPHGDPATPAPAPRTRVGLPVRPRTAARH